MDFLSSSQKNSSSFFTKLFSNNSNKTPNSSQATGFATLTTAENSTAKKQHGLSLVDILSSNKSNKSSLQPLNKTNSQNVDDCLHLADDVAATQRSNSQSSHSSQTSKSPSFLRNSQKAFPISFEESLQRQLRKKDKNTNSQNSNSFGETVQSFSSFLSSATNNAASSASPTNAKESMLNKHWINGKLERIESRITTLESISRDYQKEISGILEKLTSLAEKLDSQTRHNEEMVLSATQRLSVENRETINTLEDKVCSTLSAIHEMEQSIRSSQQQQMSYCSQQVQLQQHPVQQLQEFQNEISELKKEQQVTKELLLCIYNKLSSNECNGPKQSNEHKEEIVEPSPQTDESKIEMNETEEAWLFEDTEDLLQAELLAPVPPPVPVSSPHHVNKQKPKAANKKRTARGETVTQEEEDLDFGSSMPAWNSKRKYESTKKRRRVGKEESNTKL